MTGRRMQPDSRGYTLVKKYKSMSKLKLARYKRKITLCLKRLASYLDKHWARVSRFIECNIEKKNIALTTKNGARTVEVGMQGVGDWKDLVGMAVKVLRRPHGHNTWTVFLHQERMNNDKRLDSGKNLSVSAAYRDMSPRYHTVDPVRMAMLKEAGENNKKNYEAQFCSAERIAIRRYFRHLDNYHHTSISNMLAKIISNNTVNNFLTRSVEQPAPPKADTLDTRDNSTHTEYDVQETG